MLVITRNTVRRLPSQWCLRVSGTPGCMHSHNGVAMFGSVRAVPSRPEPSRAVPSGLCPPYLSLKALHDRHSPYFRPRNDHTP